MRLSQSKLTKNAFTKKVRHRVGKPLKFTLRKLPRLLNCHILAVPSPTNVVEDVSKLNRNRWLVILLDFAAPKLRDQVLEVQECFAKLEFH